MASVKPQLSEDVIRALLAERFIAPDGPLVPVGSYVVVEGTVFNGHPVWPGFGPGPFEAVEQVLTANGHFVRDASVEKFALSFNAGGYLKRIR